MKVWNRPVRVHYWRCKETLTLDGPKPYRGKWGVTNWMVGTCAYPWSPWVQLSLGRFSVQVKWYMVVGVLVLSGFVAGLVV